MAPLQETKRKNRILAFLDVKYGFFVGEANGLLFDFGFAVFLAGRRDMYSIGRRCVLRRLVCSLITQETSIFHSISYWR